MSAGYPASIALSIFYNNGGEVEAGCHRLYYGNVAAINTQKCLQAQRTVSKNSALNLLQINSSSHVCMQRAVLQSDDVSKHICAHIAECKICACSFESDTEAGHAVCSLGASSPNRSGGWMNEDEGANMLGAELTALFYAFVKLFSTFKLEGSPHKGSKAPSPERSRAQTPCSSMRWSASSQGGPPSLPDSSTPPAPSRKMETI